MRSVFPRLPLQSGAVPRLKPGRVAALIGVIFLGAACVDGYPTHDEPLPDPSTMSQDERVTAMNQVGEGGEPDNLWRYRLEPGCVLSVEVERPGNARRSLDVPLQGAQVAATVDGADHTHAVLVQPLGAGQQSLLQVLAGAGWFDAVRMTSLLRYLQRDCSNGPNPS